MRMNIDKLKCKLCIISRVASRAQLVDIKLKICVVGVIHIVATNDWLHETDWDWMKWRREKYLIADIFAYTLKLANDFSNFHLCSSITNSCKHSLRFLSYCEIWNGHQHASIVSPTLSVIRNQTWSLFSMAMYSCRDCWDYFQDSSEMRTKRFKIRFKNECKFSRLVSHQTTYERLHWKSNGKLRCFWFDICIHSKWKSWTLEAPARMVVLLITKVCTTDQPIIRRKLVESLLRRLNHVMSHLRYLRRAWPENVSFDHFSYFHFTCFIFDILTQIAFSPRRYQEIVKMFSFLKCNHQNCSVLSLEIKFSSIFDNRIANFSQIVQLRSSSKLRNDFRHLKSCFKSKFYFSTKLQEIKFIDVRECNNIQRDNNWIKIDWRNQSTWLKEEKHD